MIAYVPGMDKSYFTKKKRWDDNYRFLILEVGGLYSECGTRYGKEIL